MTENQTETWVPLSVVDRAATTVCIASLIKARPDANEILRGKAPFVSRMGGDADTREIRADALQDMIDRGAITLRHPPTPFTVMDEAEARKRFGSADDLVPYGIKVSFVHGGPTADRRQPA